MEGFFSKKEIESISAQAGKKTTCVSCGLFSSCNSPKMQPIGNFKKKILIIANSPTALEDEKGIPFSAGIYKSLGKWMALENIDIKEDCLCIYAVHCHTEDITENTIAACRKEVFRIIEKNNPKIIILLGEVPVKSLIAHRWKKDFGGFEKWQGWTIPDQQLNSWICPMYPPDIVVDSKIHKTIFIKNLKKVAGLINKEFPKVKEPEIIYLNDLQELDDIKSNLIAFDYETTGIKPQKAGHRVVCASVAVNTNKVYTFMMPETKEGRTPFLRILRNKNIRKIAANMKHEDHWSIIRLRTKVESWFHDTMQATHIIDNRPGICGLKFQTYVQFGIIDYSSDVDSYLDSKSKDGNAKNTIEELIKTKEGRQNLLKYCAYDSIYEYRLYELQKCIRGTMGGTELSPTVSNFPNAYSLFHEGILALAKAERNGLRIDVEYVEKQKKELQNRVDVIEKEFYKTKFYRHWQHTSKQKVNIGSGDQLSKFLYNVKKIKPAKTTSTGKGSTDEEALRMLNIPECNMLLDRSKLLKLKDTYLEAFLRESVNGFIHPSFNLHLVVTYRSSSNNPNFQNVPKRDEQSMQIIRQAIYPRINHQLAELDYKAIEVCAAACYHKDPTMLKYLQEPKSDMHRDMASQIFCLEFDKDSKKHKYLRNAAKNGFVFPQFYGDYYRNNAVGICSSWVHLPQERWKKTDGGILVSEGISVCNHLIDNGIKSFDDFVQHMKEIEAHFWTKRFPVYAQWKKDHYENYLENGYVSLYTGFTCQGVFGKNDVINYPIQGVAFHILLWLVIKLTAYFENNNLQTCIVGQIHDAVVLDIYPPEKQLVLTEARRLGTIEIKNEFPWIIVPLTIEAELCPIDKSWAEKEEWV